jgi:hypothetical protein
MADFSRASFLDSPAFQSPMTSKSSFAKPCAGSYVHLRHRATASINMNLTEVMELGKQWNSLELMDIAVHLQKSTQDANAGRLFGNRMFYANDYMVHRGKGFVTTVKMFSTRTKNTECINSQNVSTSSILLGLCEDCSR